MAETQVLGSVVYNIIFNAGDTLKTTKKVESAFAQIDKSAKKMSSGLKNVKGGTTSATTALGDLNKTSKNTATSLDKLKSSLLTGIGVGAGFTVLTSALRGVKNVIGGAIKTATQFETRMAEVSTLIQGESTDAMNDFEDAILNMTTAIPKSADDLGAGLYQVLSAGVTDSAEAMQVLEVAAKAATAGITDTNTSVDAITTVLNAYNLAASEASLVSDVFFTTIREGKTTFPALSSAIGKVANSSALAGVSFEELGASFATLTKAGISTDETATALNRLFLSMANPTKQIAEATKAMGIEFSAASLRAKGFKGFMQELVVALSQNEDAIFSLGLDMRAFKALAVLGGTGAEEFAEQIDNMADAEGAAKEAFEKMNETMENQWQILKNNLNKAFIEFGETTLPAVNKVLGYVNTKMALYSELANQVKINQNKATTSLNESLDAYNSLNRAFETTNGLQKTYIGFVRKIAQEESEANYQLEQGRADQYTRFIQRRDDEIDKFNEWKKSNKNALENMEVSYTKFSNEALLRIALVDKSMAELIIDTRINAYKYGQYLIQELTDGIASKTIGLSAKVNQVKNILSDIGGAVIKSAGTDKYLGNIISEVDNAVDRFKGIFSKPVKEPTVKKEEKEDDKVTGSVGSASKKIDKQTKDTIDTMKELGTEISGKIKLYEKLEEAYGGITDSAKLSLDLQKNKWRSVFDVLSDAEVELSDLESTYKTSLGNIKDELNDVEDYHNNISTAIDDVLKSTDRLADGAVEDYGSIKGSVDEAKEATEGFGENIEGSVDGATEAVEGLDQATKDYQDTAENNELVYESYEELQKAVDASIAKVQELKKEILSLDDQIADNDKSAAEKAASAQAAAERELKNLQQQLNDSDDPKEKARLREKIKAKKDLIASGKELNKELNFSVELEKAREDAGKNRIQLIGDAWRAEKLILEESKLAREKQLDDELLKLEDLKAQEGLLYEDQKKKLLDIWDVLTDAYEINMKARLNATKNFVSKSIDLYADLAAAAQAALAAGANLSTGAIQAISKFDDVELNGAGGGSVNNNEFTNNITINATIDSELDIETLSVQLSDLLKEQINQ